MTDVTTPFVSVIVPAYDNAAGLHRCLAALARQTYPAGSWETIVVDNGSREPLGAVVAEFPHARLVHEPQPGSYAARNRGLAEARGPVIAMIDSDCVPIPEWLARGVARLGGDPGLGFVAGRVELFFADPARPTASELYDSVVMNFHQDRHVEAGWGGVGNMFTTLRVFEAVGRFDPRLMSGGDVEWGRRVHAKGLRQLYADDVTVLHPARASVRETFTRAARVAGGRYMLKTRGGAGALSYAVDLVRAVTPAVHFYWRILRDPRLHGAGQKLSVIGVALGVKYVVAWELVRLMMGGTPNRG